ncbi:type II secretion system protein GspF, partial [Vibrio parahaemolyticus]|nr:type II secretion system protein GspF [Vibrio parahaemolyticus]
SKLLQAMLYPIVLVVFAVAIVAFLLAAVVPKIVGQFVQMGQELPKSTQFLLSSSDFIQHWGIQLLLALLVIIYVCRWLLRKPDVRLNWDRRV